jgi:Subtilase family
MAEMGDARFRSQYARVQEAYERRGIPTVVDTDPDTGRPRGIYAANRLLIRTDRLEEARAMFPEGVLRNADAPVIPGLTVVEFTGREAGETRAEIEGRLGAGTVDYDYLMSITPAGVCPAVEPDVPSPCTPQPTPCPPPVTAGGVNVRVGVSDTGLLADAATHPWLVGVTGDLDDLGPVDPVTGLDVIPLYGSHGTFVAGVLRCMAPEATVEVAEHLPVSQAGTAFVSSIVANLSAMLAAGVDVISLSAGTTTPTNDPPLAFEVFHQTHAAQLNDVVIVAAAGNNSSDQPFWPAAYREPWMVSVGALAADNQTLAWFTDFNPGQGAAWIDVFAPGDGLVNAFATGLYVYDEPPRTGGRVVFRGMARWSGTSFSTPLVAGLLAAQMASANETPHQARTALLTKAQGQAMPGVGPVLFP